MVSTGDHKDRPAPVYFMPPNLPKRKNIRLKEWDYSRPDAYFVTMCVKNRECLFGNVVAGKMILNAVGDRVKGEWIKLTDRFPHIELDEFIIMPNHMHGVIHIINYRTGEHKVRPNENPNENLIGNPRNERRDHPRWGEPCVRLPIQNGTKPHSLGRILQAFKSITTREYIRKLRADAERANTVGANLVFARDPTNTSIKLWQRDYYEHIIRNEDDFLRIQEYMMNNPGAWEEDEENPARYGRTQGSPQRRNDRLP